MHALCRVFFRGVHFVFLCFWCIDTFSIHHVPFDVKFLIFLTAGTRPQKSCVHSDSRHTSIASEAHLPASLPAPEGFEEDRLFG